MKANLSFDTTDPDDRQEFLRCVKSLDMSLALWEILYNTKKPFEREIENLEGKEYDTASDLLDDVFNKIWEIVNERDITIDDLVN